MNSNIKFLFDNCSNGETREFYETERVLEPSDSVRQAAISVINEAFAHGIKVYGEGVNNKEDAISIYISSPTINDVETGYEESGFGIKYSLNKNGAVRMLNGYYPLSHDWKFSELEELVTQGYISGDTAKLIVGRPIGLGAAPQDLFDWLGFASNVFTLAGVTNIALRRLKSIVVDCQIRKIVALWSKNGIKYPEQLREFIDTKGEWSLAEVKNALDLTRNMLLCF